MKNTISIGAVINTEPVIIKLAPPPRWYSFCRLWSPTASVRFWSECK